MTGFQGLRALHWTTFLVAAMSLSIGWGIRGNFGHEYGAMVPGALTAIAVCLLSGRADWRARVAYFGFFGALGWGFGGSISYMQVIGYTHSGHWISQLYGFFGLFLIGFLWGGMGGAGTAFPAVADRNRLTEIFRPLCWIFGFWTVLSLVVLPSIEQWGDSYQQTWHRHESPLYWFDSDWIQALTALFAVFAFDLWDRRARSTPFLTPLLAIAYLLFGLLGIAAVSFGLRVDTGDGYPAVGSSLLIAFFTFALIGAFLVWVIARVGLWKPALWGAAGAVVGVLIQGLLGVIAGRFPAFAAKVGGMVVQYQGDVALLRAHAAEQGVPFERVQEGLLINWPQFFGDIPHHLGWMIGLFLGVCVYFLRYGKFRSGASLFLYMAIGWLVSFILFPTLLGFGGAGFRLTPPRGDDWAGILGVFIATIIWAYRNRLVPVAFAAIVSGTVGGIGFAGAAFIKLMMLVPGNPERGVSDSVAADWAHWQSANWHSYLEQSYGFINGLGIALAIGLLAYRKGYLPNEPRVRRWTEVCAVAFVLFLLTWLNLSKNVTTWVDGYKNVPELMTMPLFDSQTWSAATWFNVVYAMLAMGGLLVLVRHQRSPVAAIPTSWLGKGQLFYLLFLWTMVIGNFERALPAFAEHRIITEGVIFVHAIIVTVLVLLLPRKEVRTPSEGRYNYGGDMGRALLGFLVAVLIAAPLFTAGVRAVYGDSHTGHAGEHTRFGPDAQWRQKPLEHGKEHS